MSELSSRHLFRLTDPDERRAVFKAGVERVMIETSSYCNRRCGYCPNALLDRISERKFLADALFDEVLAGLAEIDYDRHIVMHYYNEPLADPAICDKIARAAAACPKAVIEIFSNGDFLDRGYLERLRAAGLTSLVISLHLGNSHAWSDGAIIGRLSELAVRLGIAAKVDAFVPGGEIKATFPFSGMRVVVDHRDYYRMGFDRGELMANVTAPQDQAVPCLSPVTEFYVGYNGVIMPCCNLHPDAERHQPYRIGNLADFGSIFEAYADSALVDWRRELLRPGPRRSPCRTCALGVYDQAMADALHQFHRRTCGDG
jgi:MoaA/NifB/PqqE/SkfB family radical SAM enzyme